MKSLCKRGLLTLVFTNSRCIEKLKVAKQGSVRTEARN